MIVSIHQPNYFPYYGYFDKIKKSDVFVFFDSVKFTKNSFINRNRIKTIDGVKWLTVPVYNENILNTEIKDVKIFGDAWKRKHISTIEINYKKTPHFKPIYEMLQDIYSRDWENLTDLNICTVTKVCEYLNLKTKLVRSSQLDVSGESTGLIVDVCKKLKADTYYSGSSGKNYLKEEMFTDSGIVLKYQTFIHPTYHQRYGEFVGNLSILDLLLNGVTI